MMGSIAYCKIFPPIGIARVGNSEEPGGFFIGPEGLSSSEQDHSFKDRTGAVRRQAARFRVYGFDEPGRVVRELTADGATIEWSVSLANKKASWFSFHGAKGALGEFETGQGSFPLRNVSITDSDERKRRLVIDPGGPKSISGKTVADSEKYAFIGKFQDTADVYLGEIRTDDDGRLMVLGGRGHSAAVDATGKDISHQRWITHYANNDFWHDDISDGPVTCKVQVDGKDIPVRGRAWVVVAPPDFAPEIANAVTLYDVMEQAALDYDLPHAGLPPPTPVEHVEFWRDIHPILERIVGYRWVSDLGLRGHGKGKGGDFSDSAQLAKLGNPDDEDGKLLRKHIFSRIRKPPAPVSDVSETKQANGSFMPALSGDEGDATTDDPTSWLSLTRLQFARIEAWANNDFTTGAPEFVDAADPAIQPWLLTRAAMEACAGGAFYPGIEMTSITRSRKAYSEAYRIADHFEAGDVTKFMATPWQADFFECNTHWWPAQRPDSVFTAESLDELEASFAERKQGDFEQLMFIRQPWARGVDFKRPDLIVIRDKLFPEPQDDETLRQYVKRSSDIIADVFSNLIPTVKEKLPEREPGLDRIQFIVQEQFDVFGGRYFHFVVPPPAEFLADRKPGQAKRDTPRARSDAYVEFIKAALEKTCLETLLSFSKSGDTAKTFYSNLMKQSDPADGFSDGVSMLEKNTREDFGADSDLFRLLRFLNMAQCASDLLYLAWSGNSGDNGMVHKWHKLGFVIRKRLAEAGDDGTPPVDVFVETERPRLQGMQYRDYYYMLCNIDQFPEMYGYSAAIAEDFLGEARKLIGLGPDGAPSSVDSVAVEQFFEYDKNTFGAKLEEIYEYYRQQGADYRPWEVDTARADLLRRFVHLAPFNQNDGAWLRFIANSGPSDEARGLLFDVWSDEFGNGDPGLHHGNLYTALLRSLNITLPDVTSREYADYPGFSDFDFASPVFELAISQNADRYFPEILGMTLYLEWEVVDLVKGVKNYDYHGINSQFWRMHVGIDNAADGHGAKARQAVELYLDDALKSGGVEAMRREWRRIWTGFVAFASAGANYLGIDDDVAARRPQTVSGQMLDLLARKQHYGSVNHSEKRLGVNRINDWFDDPSAFIDELAHSPWVMPGDPDASRLLNHLTTFNGPMYEVFSPTDLALWRKWVLWLGCKGDTRAVKTYQTKAESMLALLQELRSAAIGTEGHLRYRLDGKLLHDWFSGDLKNFMRALAKPKNDWVVPWDAASSPLIRDFAAGTNRMAQMLDQRYPSLGNQVGRLVITRWITAGCPIPGEPIPSAPKASSKPIERKATLVQLFGQGSVH